MFISGHIRFIFVLPKLLHCWRQQDVFGPPQVTQQHCCLCCGCVVPRCDFLSPQLIFLRYSIWLLYCRSAIVLMTLETHAVTLPQVLTPCSNHHTHGCRVCTQQFMAVHMEWEVSGVLHAPTVSSSYFPWDYVVACSVAEFPVCSDGVSLQSGGHKGHPVSLWLYT